MSEPVLTLNDKYTRTEGRVYMTGVQALTRLLLDQSRRDRTAGLNTAGFVSGYRGSPLGGVDRALWEAADLLKAHDIVFMPGVNEELAATAVLGSQQAAIYPGARFDGVFGLWYGKGPGLDRAADALKHANSLGTSAKGGVLVVVGDDHTAMSSAHAHQGEQAFASWSMPVLHPAGIHEFIEFGLHGYALSRFSGCWVGFKTASETVETAISVEVRPDHPRIAIPDFAMPPGGLHLRWPDPQLAQEARLQNFKLPAAQAFARANRLDRTIWTGEGRGRLGIVTAGKAHLDAVQALDDLGIDEARARSLGIRLYKVGMVWPLEPTALLEFARGVDELLIVEEKRAFVETQAKELLFNLPVDRRPRVVGKTDAAGAPLLPAVNEFSAGMIAEALVRRLPELGQDAAVAAHLAFLRRRREECSAPPIALRPPYFCSGCPHNISTQVPAGSRAHAGTGCHLMSAFMKRETTSFIQMGGEGVNWIGQSYFTDTPHTFQNLGDGTYVHSGSLAIRQAVAAGRNITYKILYNDAVAMTGGQPFEGGLTPAAITRQVQAEGVARIAVIGEDNAQRKGGAFAPGVTFHSRKELDRVQRELREVKGVSVILFDQTCAAEKRRRRKRGAYPDPELRAYINQDVCDACGDCSVQSNCISVVPVETPDGRKRSIDQSSCNKDFSCVEGFCPAIVTLEGARPRKGLAMEGAVLPAIPLPAMPSLAKPLDVLVAGIGGTGVVTIGQIIAIAAHMDGLGVAVLDFTGLSQKGGGVLTQLRLGARPEDVPSARIAPGEADLLIAGDLVVAVGNETLAKLRRGTTRAVVNAAISPTAASVLDADAAIDATKLRAALTGAVGEERIAFLDAPRIAEKLTGDAITANMFLLGYAWQSGTLPIRLESLSHAIALNGVSVEANRRCFGWGRLAAHDPARLVALVGRLDVAAPSAESLGQIVERHAAYLTDYQDAAYAQRYRQRVARAEEAERRLGRRGLAEAVARGYFKLLAYKDEYEVARLFTQTGFLAEIAERFEGVRAINLHIFPSYIGRRDPQTGRLLKTKFGPWVLSVFALLARLKGLRGTWLDPFRFQAERKIERRLIADYETTLDELLAALDAERHDLAVEIARLPEGIRGFGHVKDAAVAKVEARRAERLALFRSRRNAIDAVSTEEGDSPHAPRRAAVLPQPGLSHA